MLDPLSQSLSVLLLPLSIAGFAVSLGVAPLAPYHDVVTEEGMPALAVSLCRFQGASDGCSSSSAHVLAVRDRLQMSRVYTGGIATDMVHIHPVRNRPNEKFIGETMRGHLPSHKVGSLPDKELAVARWVASAGPKPARFGDKQVLAEAFDGAFPRLFHTMKSNSFR